MDEFDLIATLFAPLAADAPGARGLADDAAVLDPRPDRALVVAADALVEGVHFLPHDPPDLVARKLLRVNLSDMAAMGAEARGYLLTVQIPRDRDDAWLRAFADGLAADQREFGVTLLGGDTVSTPGPFAASITMLGETPPGAALGRDGAAAGEGVYVSGTLGDAALGLDALKGRLDDLASEDRAALAERYRLPRPRLALGCALRGLASAAIDVSDGLVADLGHIAACSGVGIEIDARRLPLSPAAARAVAAEPARLARALAGGDDYELAFTSAAGDEAIAALSRALSLPLTRIGRVGAGNRVVVNGADGIALETGGGGYRHR